MTVVEWRLREDVVEGKRLGRHIKHDSRSLLYTPAGAPLQSVHHATNGLPLDQGQLGSCTANALCGALNTAPNFTGKVYTETDALDLYERETADEGKPYPPNDPGGNGLDVCRAAVEYGWVSSYAAAIGVHEALAALVLRPVITGVNWYTSFDTPDANGLVAIADGATVRGGHEIMADGIDVANELVWFTNSWGPEYGVDGRFCWSWDTWDTLLQQGGDVYVPVAA